VDGPDPVTKPRAGDARAVMAVLAAMTLVAIDGGMVSVALPTIARSFAIAPAEAVSVVTSYQLAVVLALLPCAHLAGRVGQRSLFTCGIALFAGSSLCSAIAPSLELMIAARFIQGVGGAAIMALGIAMLRANLAAPRLHSAIGWNAMTVAGCGAVGPLLAALTLETAGWRMIFLPAVPVALVSIYCARAFPRTAPGPAGEGLASLACYLSGAILLVLAITSAGQRPWLAASFAAGSIVPIAALVLIDRKHAAPLVPFDLLRRAPLRMGAIASICCFTAQSAGFLGLIFRIEANPVGGIFTGAIVASLWPLGAITAASLAAQLERRFSYGTLCTVGGSLLAAGLGMAAVIPSQAGLALLSLYAFLCGMGFGTFQVPNNRNLLLGARPDRSAAAGAVQATSRLAGQTAGSSLVALLLASSGPVAPRLAMAMASFFALAAALVARRAAHVTA